MKTKHTKRIFMLWTVSACLLLSNMGMASTSQLTDDELSNTTGQALLGISSQTNADGIRFDRVGLNAEVAMNTNIQKLQLGCGGIARGGVSTGCDIDIDNVSLSGESDTSEGRVGSDAVLTNPFFEFAFKNPNSKSTRELIGIRAGAEKLNGLMTMGSANTDTPNGINRFSGYMNVLPSSGTGQTASRNMTYADTGLPMTGRLNILFGATLSFSSTDYNLTLNSSSAPFTTNPFIMKGSRLESANGITGLATMGDINFSGPMKNVVSGLLTINGTVAGSISGLKANILFNQDLGFIHKIPITGSSTSLSVQKENVLWPGQDANSKAQAGWWLAFTGAPVNLGNFTPSNQIQITNDVLKQTVPPINNYLNSHPIPCTLGLCAFGTINVGNINLDGTYVDMPLSDLKLAAQNFAPNCFGGRTFC